MSGTVNQLFYSEFGRWKGYELMAPYVFSKMIRVVVGYLFLEQLSMVDFI